GYSKTRLEFDASPDTFDADIVNAGLYGSLLRGRFFADLLIKDDYAKVNLDLPAYPGVDNVNANSYGAELAFGARFGTRYVFEPFGTAAYVRTTVKNLDSAGMNLDWKDGASLRGTLGLKLSGQLGSDQTQIRPFIVGGVGREFDGEYNLLLTTGSSSLT